MFGSFLGKLPDVGFGDCLSAIGNILHGPGLSFGFSSFISSLEIKPQEKTVQQFGSQSIRCAAFFVIFSYAISSLSFWEVPAVVHGWNWMLSVECEGGALFAPLVKKEFLLIQDNSKEGVSNATAKAQKLCRYEAEATPLLFLHSFKIEQK